MIEIVTPSIVLKRGLELVGFDERRQNTVQRSMNLKRFCAHFGSKPGVYAAIWSDLQQTTIDAARVDIDAMKTRLEHMLMATHFLKCYLTASQSEAIFKLSDTTICKWVWFYVGKLRALKEDKIVWPSHWNPSNNATDESIFIITVDGVHCRICEPKHPHYSKNPAFYSHKFKQAGLSYEIALSVYENRCVSMNGPFAAGKNDLSIF